MELTSLRGARDRHYLLGFVLRCDLCPNGLSYCNRFAVRAMDGDFVPPVLVYAVAANAARLTSPNYNEIDHDGQDNIGASYTHLLPLIVACKGHCAYGRCAQ